MKRFLLISFFLHFLFVVLLSYRKFEYIENPILSVEIVETNKQDESVKIQKKVKPVAQPRPDGLLQGKKLESQNIVSQQSENTDSDQSSEVYESQQVTKLPRVLKQIKASYPEPAKQARIEGVVKLSVLIDPSGTVTEVIVLEGPGHGLNETAQQALYQFRFSPAEKQNQPVSVKITYNYRFRLDSR